MCIDIIIDTPDTIALDNDRKYKRDNSIKNTIRCA